MLEPSRGRLRTRPEALPLRLGLEATGGKTYAQMDREDPARQTAFTASALRASLMAAVLAWETANLAMGFGAFVAGIGLLLLVTLLLLRPKFKNA